VLAWEFGFFGMPTRKNAMHIEKTPEELQAQNQWLSNVNSKLVVMIKNAADVLQEYVQSLDQILVALRETQTIYLRLHQDLTEALNEPPNTTNTELQQPDQGYASERGSEPDLSDSSCNPDPFGTSDAGSPATE